MANRLFQVISFVDVAASDTVELTHDINVGGVTYTPDMATPDTTGFTVTATSSTVTVTNTNSDIASCDVLLQLWNSQDRCFGPDTTPGSMAGGVSPRPFVPASGGAGGGGGDCLCPGRDPDTSTQVGIGALASGSQTVAVGVSSSSLEDSVAVGFDAVAIAVGAIAIGKSAHVEGKSGPTDGIAIGNAAEVQDGAIKSLAIGGGAHAIGPSAIALGHGAVADDNEWVVGSADSPINNFDIKAASDSLFRALLASVDITASGGPVGVLISVDRGGVIAAEQVFCGPTGSGPGAAGRALFIAD